MMKKARQEAVYDLAFPVCLSLYLKLLGHVIGVSGRQT